MDTYILQRQFAAIGAHIDIDVIGPGDRGYISNRANIGSGYTIDVQERKRGESFLLSVQALVMPDLDLVAVDIRPAQRHLLLLARREDQGQSKDKFLCGHDERHWFVAQVPGERGVTTVRQAMDSLKPEAAVVSQLQHGVRAQHWQDRHNPGYIRQGEWFFIPMPGWEPAEPLLIRKNEPIWRGRSKAHWVERLYREGGESVYACAQHPNGLLEEEYRDLVARQPEAARWNWRLMKRGMRAYGLGAVRHPDHKTIRLPFWHEILMSTETSSVSGGVASPVVFLD